MKQPTYWSLYTQGLIFNTNYVNYLKMLGLVWPRLVFRRQTPPRRWVTQRIQDVALWLSASVSASHQNGSKNHISARIHPCRNFTQSATLLDVNILRARAVVNGRDRFNPQQTSTSERSCAAFQNNAAGFSRNRTTHHLITII